MSRIQVTRATIHDIIEMLPLLREFSDFASAKYVLYPGDNLAIRGLWQLIVNHPVFVARLDDKMIGCVAGQVYPHTFNPTIRWLSELFWWVTPAHRGTRAGLLLLEALIEWAKQNVHVFAMTLESNSPVNPRTLEKRGFRLRENHYFLEI